MAIAHIAVLSSALVTLYAVTAVRRGADDLVRRRSWSQHCPEQTRALRDLDHALCGADASAVPADVPIRQIEDDLRRLNRQRRADGQSRLWMDVVELAYDQRLCMACRCLGVAEHLKPLGGLDRQIERVRVEGELQAAGLTLHP